MPASRPCCKFSFALLVGQKRGGESFARLIASINFFFNAVAQDIDSFLRCKDLRDIPPRTPPERGVFYKYWSKLDFSFKNIIPIICSIPLCGVWRLVQMQVCGFWFLTLKLPPALLLASFRVCREPGRWGSGPLHSCGCHFSFLDDGVFWDFAEEAAPAS